MLPVSAADPNVVRNYHLAADPKPIAAEIDPSTREIAERCRFSLDELRYEYPEEIVPAGTTPALHLRRLVEEGAFYEPDCAEPGGVFVIDISNPSATR